MPAERTRYRNVHFHNASTGELLGGFYQKGSVIGMNMLDILKHVLLVVDGGFDISVRHRETGVDLTQSPQPVALGDYDIYSQGMNYTYMNLHRQITHCALGSIKLTDESWVPVYSPIPCLLEKIFSELGCGKGIENVSS